MFCGESVLCYLVRLAESERNALEGRLEVYNYRNTTWGTVCNDRFNDTAAKVVCNSLGFGYVVCVVLGIVFNIHNNTFSFWIISIGQLDISFF